jgi:hypothetical protein
MALQTYPNKELFEEIRKMCTNSSVYNCTNVTEEMIRDVMSGVYYDSARTMEIDVLRHILNEIIVGGCEPIIHNDSMTNWCNESVNYCLTIKDILNMDCGDTMEVILIDRNVGDYTHHYKSGTVYDPRKEGLTYGIYTHVDGISGIMNFTDIGIIRPFTWELNMDENMRYWVQVCVNNKYGDYTNFDINTKVGWCGPAITLKDSYKLPETVKHYGGVNWFNDYGILANKTC